MTAPTHTADLAGITATTLRRLAAEMRAAIPEIDRLRREAENYARQDDTLAAAMLDHRASRLRDALAETRREAAADLRTLGDSLPTDPTGGEEVCPRNDAWAQAALVAHNATSDEIDRWATAWERHGEDGAP